jgi:hypothetical protein
MDILSWLALVMVTLAGYSAGAVLGGRVKSSSIPSIQSPTLLDTLTVAVLWFCAILSRMMFLGRWTAVGVWFISGLIVAFLLSLIQRQKDPGKSIAQ